MRTVVLRRRSTDPRRGRRERLRRWRRPGSPRRARGVRAAWSRRGPRFARAPWGPVSRGCRGGTVGARRGRCGGIVGARRGRPVACGRGCPVVGRPSRTVVGRHGRRGGIVGARRGHPVACGRGRTVVGHRSRPGRDRGRRGFVEGRSRGRTVVARHARVRARHRPAASRRAIAHGHHVTHRFDHRRPTDLRRSRRINRTRSDHRCRHGSGGKPSGRPLLHQAPALAGVGTNAPTSGRALSLAAADRSRPPFPKSRLRLPCQRRRLPGGGRVTAAVHRPCHKTAAPPPIVTTASRLTGRDRRLRSGSVRPRSRLPRNAAFQVTAKRGRARSDRVARSWPTCGARTDRGGAGPAFRPICRS